MAYKVIDVSNPNGDIDFEKVKSSGVWGVIIRAGYTGYGASHSLNKDDRFEKNYAAAKKAGLHVGSYYYSGAMSEDFAEKEAKYFLSLLKGKQFDLPVYMDVEETHFPTNMTSLGKSRLTNIVYKWCVTVEAAHYFTGFYTAKSWTQSYLEMTGLSRFTFWLAHWTKKTDYSGPYAMWQYSDSGTIPGINGNVDLDWCYTNFPQRIKAAGLNGYKEPTYSVIANGLDKAKADKAVAALKSVGVSAMLKEA